MLFLGVGVELKKTSFDEGCRQKSERNCLHNLDAQDQVLPLSRLRLNQLQFSMDSFANICAADFFSSASHFAFSQQYFYEDTKRSEQSGITEISLSELELAEGDVAAASLAQRTSQTVGHRSVLKSFRSYNHKFPLKVACREILGGSESCSAALGGGNWLEIAVLF